MQKGVGFEIENQHLVRASHVGAAQRPDGRFCLAVRRAKGRKIVFAQQQASSLLHAFCVQRVVVPADAAMPYAGALRPVEQKVAVAASAGRETGVKGFIHGFGPADGDGRRQQGVAAAHPGCYGARDLRVEMRDLRAGVDAGVGASGADQSDFFSGDAA